LDIRINVVTVITGSLAIDSSMSLISCQSSKFNILQLISLHVKYTDVRFGILQYTFHKKDTDEKGRIDEPPPSKDRRLLVITMCSFSVPVQLYCNP
jgi:hypothetical protein